MKDCRVGMRRGFKEGFLGKGAGHIPGKSRR